MCCLFGMLDYGDNLNGYYRSQIVHILAKESEVRGTDAAGIAYNAYGTLLINKRPGPAHKLRIYLPDESHVIMGHTRMTTQGSEKLNYNNHPFMGKAQNTTFALAHNGVLYNDRYLRKNLKLPNTRIETDSFIAVQLIEKQQTLDFSSLKYMAEQVEGSFTFTVLDQKNNLHIVKGDSPFCLYCFANLKIYLYASTKDILNNALQKMGLENEPYKEISMRCGEILQIRRNGTLSWEQFDTGNFQSQPIWDYRYVPAKVSHSHAYANPDCQQYNLQAIASLFGYPVEVIRDAVDDGLTLREIEELLNF